VLNARFEGWSSREIESKVASIMRSYDTDLNHMSIRRFRGMVANAPGLAVTREVFRPAKFSFLGVLTKIPAVRELFTGTVICRLERARR
jgi:hypothetical protein